MILIGSRALCLRNNNLLTRTPLDFDWVCSKEEFDIWLDKNLHKVLNAEVYELPQYNKWIVRTPETAVQQTICEFEIIKPDTSSELLVDLVEKDKETIETPFAKVPSLSILFAIKDSHKFKKFGAEPKGSQNWYKHAIDWHQMKRAGAVIKPEYEAFQKLRKAEAYAGQKHPKLNVSTADFFKDDGIDYRYNHDDIHEAVKILAAPAYTYYLKDGETVLCDKQKFFDVSEEVRLAGGTEECLTLALERSLLMSNVWTSDYAFKFALSKVCSSITSGFFRLWCFENMFGIFKMYEETSKNYHEKFKEALAAGKIRPFDGSKY